MCFVRQIALPKFVTDLMRKAHPPEKSETDINLGLDFSPSCAVFDFKKKRDLRQKGVDTATKNQSRPPPKPGNEPAQPATKSGTPPGGDYGLDAEETHLGLMAVAAGREVAMRAATATPEELRCLRDLHRLWDLRLDLYQKSQAAALLPDPLQTKAQYNAAGSLVKTQNELRKLEAKLFGSAEVSEKDARAREAKRRMSAYEKPPSLAA